MLIVYKKTDTETPTKSTWEKPKDWAYMEQSGEVLRNLPETWMQYPDTVPGMMAIIDMEFNELHQATTDKEKSHELVHLGSACLRLWRRLNHAE